MAIRVGEDELLTLAQAARRLPPRNNGKRLHVAALYRWTSTGCGGVVLETIQLGGQRFTSVAALQRFAESLTQQARAARPGAPRASAAATKPAGVDADVARAEREVGRLLGVEPQREAGTDASSNAPRPAPSAVRS
jgi:hypothetical protein